MKPVPPWEPTVPARPDSLTVIWRFLIGARKMITLVRNRPTNTIILLNILYSTVQNLVTCETWHPGFMHQWSRILWNTSRHIPCTPHVLSSLHVEARNQAKSDSVKNSAFLLITVLLRTYCRSAGYTLHIVKNLHSELHEMLILFTLTPCHMANLETFRETAQRAL